MHSTVSESQKSSGLDICHLALSHQRTVLSKFRIKILANQIVSSDQNASDWFRIEYAARGPQTNDLIS